MKRVLMQVLKKNRLARSAFLVILIGVLYIITVAYALSTANAVTNEINRIPKLIMEFLTVISAWILFIFVLSIATKSDFDYNSIVAVILMGLFLLTTLAVHFISIVLSRTSLNSDAIMTNILSFSWPSILYALDILSWNCIFGVALLYIGFHAKRIYSKRIGNLIAISGVICLSGLVALPLNNMNFRFIGVAGYTVFPILIGSLVLYKEIKNER